jgi:ribosomal protein S18 acetylase RimI-like enzyme
MKIIDVATKSDMHELLVMSQALWPDYTATELETTFNSILESEKFQILLYRTQVEAVGFIYIGIRTDYVEGSDSSPTGYVEGIYVKPGFRRSGVARSLLEAGEVWLRQQGCTQVGSDIYIDNQTSYNFHIHSGFKEAGRLIAFIKDL